MMHLELKLERLSNEELEREDILICAVGYFVRKIVDGDHLILGLGRQEQARQPVRKAKCRGRRASQTTELASASAEPGVNHTRT